MAAPTFVSATTTTVVSGSTAKTTASIAVQNGDVLVAFGLAENSTTTIAIATATGSTSVWTLKRDITNTGASNPYSRAWTATATATGNITVSFTLATSTIALCGIVKVWRNSGGIGATNIADNNIAAGSPSVGVTTTGANSALDFSNTDWNGVTGTATFTASSGTPVTDLSNQTSSGNYCVYSAHVLDAGAIGAKTFGMSAPAAQRYICDVIEVLGSSAAFIARPNSPILQAVKRASYW